MITYVDSIIIEGLNDDKKQQKIIKGILEYIQSKKHMFQILLEKDGDLDLQWDILTSFGEHIFQNEHTDTLSGMRKAYQFIYASTENFGFIYYWIMDDKPVEIDTMANWVTSFNTSCQKS